MEVYIKWAWWQQWMLCMDSPPRHTLSKADSFTLCSPPVAEAIAELYDTIHDIQVSLLEM